VGERGGGGVYVCGYVCLRMATSDLCCTANDRGEKERKKERGRERGRESVCVYLCVRV